MSVINVFENIDVIQEVSNICMKVKRYIENLKVMKSGLTIRTFFVSRKRSRADVSVEVDL